MKKSRLAVIAASLALCVGLLSAPAQGGSVACRPGDVFTEFTDMATPFGTAMGNPATAFPELKGKHVTSRETYVVRFVPQPARHFDLYLLTFEDDGKRCDGLSSVSGAVVFRKGEHGLMEFFSKQTRVFQKHFGDPSYYLDQNWIRFLKKRRPECDELMEALFADKKQSFTAAWDLKGRPDKLKRVQIQFFPQSRDECWGVASFFFENYR